MLLAVDIGNSYCKFGAFFGKKLRTTLKVRTDLRMEADRLKEQLKSFFDSHHLSIDQFERMVISSVVPGFRQVVEKALGASVPIAFIDHCWHFSFSNHTDVPEKVGIDRLVSSEAAVREFGAPCLVADLGTASTISAITLDDDSRPRLIGGVIMPGLRTSHEALIRNTSLPLETLSVEYEKDIELIGRNTTDAVRSGIVIGHASMIDGMIDQLREKLKCPTIPVVATGGMSQVLRLYLTRVTSFQPILTLRGIQYLHESVYSR